MIKRILLTITALCTVWTMVFAGPFVVSDPNPDMPDEYTFDCTQGTVVQQDIPAISNPDDGSFEYDMGNWTYGYGWFDCEGYAVANFEVEDGITGEKSQAPTYSDPAPFKLKVPKKPGKINKYKVKR